MPPIAFPPGVTSDRPRNCSGKDRSGGTSCGVLKRYGDGVKVCQTRLEVMSALLMVMQYVSPMIYCNPLVCN